MLYSLRSILSFSAIATGLLVPTAHASVVLSNTRLVLEEQNQEAQIMAQNPGNMLLIQSWLEADGTEHADELPFAVSPTLARLQPGSKQILRVMYAGDDTDNLPTDKESVMWLNVQEIPQNPEGDSADGNYIQFALRQRIKVFYRPKGLVGKVEDMPAALYWEITRADNNVPQLTVHNPTAYHSTITKLETADGQKLKPPMMIAPGANHSIALGNVSPTAQLVFGVVNDYGGVDEYELQLSEQGPAQAKSRSILEN